MADAISTEALIPGAPDKTLTFATGKLAGLADGAVDGPASATPSSWSPPPPPSRPARASTSSRSPSTSRSACTPPGKIPGSFFRREGKAPDQAILTCRLIDRPLRPCFPDGLPQRGPRRRHHPRRRPARTPTTCSPSTPPRPR